MTILLSAVVIPFPALSPTATLLLALVALRSESSPMAVLKEPTSPQGPITHRIILVAEPIVEKRCIAMAVVEGAGGVLIERSITNGVVVGTRGVLIERRIPWALLPVEVLCASE